MNTDIGNEVKEARAERVITFVNPTDRPIEVGFEQLGATLCTICPYNRGFGDLISVTLASDVRAVGASYYQEGVNALADNRAEANSVFTETMLRDAGLVTIPEYWAMYGE